MCSCENNSTESNISQELIVTDISPIMELMVSYDRYKEFSQRLNAVLDFINFPPKGKNRQKILGDLFHVGQKGARKWLESEAMPKQTRHPEFIEKLNKQGADITGEWLFYGDQSKAPLWYKQLTAQMEGQLDGITGNIKAAAHPLVNNIEIGPDTRGYVPLISWVQAGDWCDAVVSYEPPSAEDWLPCPVSHGPRTYALRVKGDSMTSPYPGQRSYPEGTIIYVDPDRSIINGCRIVARQPFSNEVTFKEYREDSGTRYLKPINPQYQMQEIGDDTRICGVVIGQFIGE